MTTPLLPIDQTQLDTATRAASATMDAARSVVTALVSADTTKTPPDIEALWDLAQDANERATQTYRLLVEAGGREPQEYAVGRRLSAEENPLRLLALATSPAARRLLDLLREAQDAAEALDAERGNVIPERVELPPTEPRGTEYAELVGHIRARLAAEVEGPSSGGRE